MLVAVSACMLAATFGHARNMPVAVFGSAYMLAAVSDKIGSAANSGSLATGIFHTKGDSKAKDALAHSNMEQYHEHILWKPTVTVVMTTLLLLSLATSEARGNISCTLVDLQNIDNENLQKQQLRLTQKQVRMRSE